MHAERELAHCDFKSDNILVTFDFGLSLIDFAHMTNLGSPVTRSSGVGTLAYNSPEAITAAAGQQGAFMPGPHDCYSLGAFIVSLLFLCMPFDSTTSKGLMAREEVSSNP
jgi:serine/threonine protein kinase